MSEANPGGPRPHRISQFPNRSSIHGPSPFRYDRGNFARWFSPAGRVPPAARLSYGPVTPTLAHDRRVKSALSRFTALASGWGPAYPSVSGLVCLLAWVTAQSRSPSGRRWPSVSATRAWRLALVCPLESAFPYPLLSA